jgi:hypothetical protein
MATVVDRIEGLIAAWRGCRQTLGEPWRTDRLLLLLLSSGTRPENLGDAVEVSLYSDESVVRSLVGFLPQVVQPVDFVERLLYVWR